MADLLAADEAFSFAVCPTPDFQEQRSFNISGFLTLEASVISASAVPNPAGRHIHKLVFNAYSSRNIKSSRKEMIIKA